MNLFSKQLDDTGRIKLLKLTGEMDASLAAWVQQGIEKIIQDGCRGLTLDMSGVDYIDSSGIRVLLSSYKKLKKLGGRINILNPSEKVLMILELADLIDVLKIFKTMDEAVADLSIAP